MDMGVGNKKSLVAPLINTAAVLGAVQGISTFVLSLIAILYYEGKIQHTANNNGTHLIGEYIFDRYLYKPNNDFVTNTSIIGPKQFNYFMYFYLAFSSFVLTVSLLILHASITGKSANYHILRVCCWTIDMSCLTILDFVLTFLLAHDYHQIKIEYDGLAEDPDIISAETTALYEATSLTTVGIMMTIAAKGFVLWIVNVVFIVILEVHLFGLYKKSKVRGHIILDTNATG